MRETGKGKKFLGTEKEETIDHQGKTKEIRKHKRNKKRDKGQKTENSESSKKKKYRKVTYG